MGQIAESVLAALFLAVAAPVTLWTCGAIYFDVCRERRWGRWAALSYALGVVLLFALLQPLWQAFAVFIGISALFLAWWFSQKPRNDRDWHPTAAVLPHAKIDGDVITIEHVRNFEYRTLEDFTPRYETRTYHLANLCGADVIFFVWEVSWMGHPVVVFDFGPNGRICMSIEVRYRMGQKYSIWRALYRQHELIFIAADERDIILRRTKYSKNQKAYLYHVNAKAEELRAVFLDYMNAINDLHRRPRWYHVVFWNCATTFYRLPSTPTRLNWRVIANGRLDWALYKDGRIDRTLPFDETRRLAYLNDIANAAPEEGFGDYIRKELERRRHER
jgi:Domain of unknown function (DUF4105)